MEAYKAINWHEKETDEIYEFHRDIENEKEALDFVMHLLTNYPEFQLAWIDMIVDSMYPLLHEGEVEEVARAVEEYSQVFPDEYRNEYEFVETELISHYLYRHDLENVKKRLGIVAQNPKQGIDTVTVKAMFQLIYHGYYDTALAFAQQVWEPLFESRSSGEFPHFPFSSTIYLYSLEKEYEFIKSGGKPDVKAFKKEMDGYDIDEDEKAYHLIFNALSKPLEKEMIFTKFINNEPEWTVILNIQFLKFMKETYNIPFMLADRFWNMLTVSDLFGSEPSPEGFLYIPYTTLAGHFAEQSDKMFLSNELEMFGKVWGLDYAYHFIHESGLMNDHFYSLMSENIQILKNEYIRSAYTSLWQMNFVFSWPQLYLPDTYEKQLFSDTYRQNDQNVKDRLDSYIDFKIVPERIQKEISKEKASEYKNSAFNEQLSNAEGTYIRLEPKTGRNDPCPCGSGKKYKKCCMDKN